MDAPSVDAGQFSDESLLAVPGVGTSCFEDTEDFDLGLAGSRDIVPLLFVLPFVIKDEILVLAFAFVLDDVFLATVPSVALSLRASELMQ